MLVGLGSRKRGESPVRLGIGSDRIGAARIGFLCAVRNGRCEYAKEMFSRRIACIRFERRIWFA